jgi:hypothetical protein
VDSLRSGLLKIDRIHYFDIHYSIFAFSEFLLRLDWPLFRLAAALTPDPPQAEHLNTAGKYGNNDKGDKVEL